MILTSMSEQEEARKLNKEIKYLWDKDENNLTLMQE